MMPEARDESHVSFDGHNSLESPSMRIVFIACLYPRERFNQAPSHAGSGSGKRGLMTCNIKMEFTVNEERASVSPAKRV